MRTRLLPRDEWHRLRGTELAEMVPLLGDVETRVFVVEDDDGAIIGCWALMQVWHAEGLFVAPEHRGKAAVARHLLTFLRRMAAAEDIPGVVTSSVDPEVTALLDGRLGAMRLPGTHYVLPLLRVTTQEEKEPCLPQ